MAASALSLADLEKDPRLFLYTSLTAGSSHIITATSRLETILKANKIPFQAIDIATDEKARRLWQRRAGQKKLPGLVKEGYILGDLAEIEEWNEFGELKENIGTVPENNAAPPGGLVGVQIAPPLNINPTATLGMTKVTAPPVSASNSNTAAKSAAPAQSTGFDKSKGIALPGAVEIAARNKPAPATTETPSSYDALNAETQSSSAATKQKSIEEAKEAAMTHPSIEHLSAPASAIHSGTATPQQSAEPGTTTDVGSVAETAEGDAAAPVEDTAAAEPGTEEKDEDSKTDDVVSTEATPARSSAADTAEAVEAAPESSEVKAVEGLSLQDKMEAAVAVPTQKQDAKDGENAATSVED